MGGRGGAPLHPPRRGMVANHQGSCLQLAPTVGHTPHRHQFCKGLSLWVPARAAIVD